jgi:hypothetical protein
MESLIYVAAILGVAGYVLLRRYLWAQAAMKRREMTHKERILAMEKGIPLEGLGPIDDLPDGLQPPPMSQERALVLTRLTALGVGLFFLTTGLGLCLGFRYADNTDLSSIWSVGLIPILGGVGLLLFVALSGRFDPGRSES